MPKSEKNHLIYNSHKKFDFDTKVIRDWIGLEIKKETMKQKLTRGFLNTLIKATSIWPLKFISSSSEKKTMRSVAFDTNLNQAFNFITLLQQKIENFNCVVNFLESLRGKIWGKFLNLSSIRQA